MQVLLLSGSTLVAALSVLALKSLPQVRQPVNSPGTKLKLRVSLLVANPKPVHNSLCHAGHILSQPYLVHGQCVHTPG